MGSCKHNYWHWLHCQLPQGQVSLTDLKLTHPEVIPNRDTIAAPMRLASWVRFETLMASDDWEGAISMLVSNLHQPDKELLRLLQLCVSEQKIASMEEAQALLLRNCRVDKDNQSGECTSTELLFPHGRKLQFSAQPTSSTTTLSSWRTVPQMKCTWAAR